MRLHLVFPTVSRVIGALPCMPEEAALCLGRSSPYKNINLSMTFLYPFGTVFFLCPRACHIVSCHGLQRALL